MLSASLNKTFPFICVFADEVRSVVAAGGGVRRQLRSGSRLVP